MTLLSNLVSINHLYRNGKKQEKKICDAALTRNLKLLKKNRPSTKHNHVHRKLYSKFETSRRKGLRISFTWLYANASKINKELKKDANHLPKSAVTAFIRKYRIKFRRVQRKKKLDKTVYLPKIMKWHSTLREVLVKSKNDSTTYDPKWGRFLPGRWLNVDQIPLPFAIHKSKTYDLPVPTAERRNYRTWVSTPGSGFDKTQCTLQICYSPGDTKIRIAIIFCVKGKRITDDELKAYHKNADIYWQTNDWADTEFSVNWVKNTLKPAVSQDESEFFLFCDNLSPQVSEAFLKEICSINGIVWFGELGATDIWQPVDNRFGKMLK